MHENSSPRPSPRIASISITVSTTWIMSLVALMLCCCSARSFAAERWSPCCINDGEGGQVIVAIAASAADPDRVLFGTDVGGLYRSTDGGDHWHATGAGFDALTGLDIAWDPRNADRVFVVGSSPSAGPYCGVHRSVDGAATWQRVLPDPAIHDIFDRRGNRQIVIDGSSFDASAGVCTRVYYASGSGDLWTSQDGGDTWSKCSSPAARCLLAIDSKGALFAAGERTLWRSSDHGATFEAVYHAPGRIGALDAAGDHVVLCVDGAGKIYVSADRGRSFQAKATQGIAVDQNTKFVSVRVSPADADRMMTETEKPRQCKYVSQDGGELWTKIDISDMRHSIINGSDLPDVPFAWHPRDKNIAWEARHDYMTQSTDGGRSFHWSNRGYGGIFSGQGGTFFFNVRDPNCIALPSVDWNGAVTQDAGRTWRQINGDPTVYPWWGWTYGCYGVGPNVWFFGASQAHSPWKQQLKITRDGGKTFETHDLPVDWRPSWTCYQDPTRPDIWFYCNYRSTDAGHTWQAIDADVLTHDPVSGTLYGRAWKKSPKPGWAVLRSDDHGATWQTVFMAGGGDLRDIAVDHQHGIVFALHPWGLDRYDTSTRSLKIIKDFPPDQFCHGPNLWSVAIDPVDPNILYVANGGHYYQPDTSVMRSTDGGQTWQSISVSKRLGTLRFAAPGGGGCVDALWCRVNPKTRNLLVGTNDFGFWKFEHSQ